MDAHRCDADDALRDIARDVGLLSDSERSTLVVGPPSPLPGRWAGAPCALWTDGSYWLAYRLRRPVGRGRGYVNVVARSFDGVTFETVTTVHKDMFGAASLERPTLVRSDQGVWRLYVSCATPGSFHWRVDLLEAAAPEQLANARPRTVLPGGPGLAAKDPVIVRGDDGWHLWASCHPLDDPRNTDRMTTRYATSPDGVRWTWRGTALAGRPGRWDARGARISAVLCDGARPVACYDGRASAEENWEERTGVAVGGQPFGTFARVGDAPVAQSPHAGHGLRYVTVVGLPEGRRRFYFEITRPDGAHELRTTFVDTRH